MKAKCEHQMPNGRDFIFFESSGVLAAAAAATSKLLGGKCMLICPFPLPFSPRFYYGSKNYKR